jgi:hypothetical protein
MSEFFAKAGHPCPENHNPADHALFLVQTLPIEGINVGRTSDRVTLVSGTGTAAAGT